MGEAEDVIFGRQYVAKMQAQQQNQVHSEECFSRIKSLLTVIPELVRLTNYTGLTYCRMEVDGWRVGYDISERGLTDNAGDDVEIHVLADGRLFINNFDFQESGARRILAAQNTVAVEITLSRLESHI